ncbi:Uncharacterized conserved protein, contains HEPN domain [Pilibacter termitis]|uniref:Uncharacterized conserved protein, contains HEPN domain n=1 Tax=Pilibacter termitis TaxID=263852 RepID=A0A1T4P9M1_9ENTE|nr:HepT-like ribonuclease domain-containing protein [Pilibacter termitis]SJZ88260.1 Uncharacterized conserved protein, contains HEPN domain [Pilibacter termitis]
MRERLEKDLFHIELMLERLYRIGEYTKRFSALGLDLRDEMVLDDLAFQLIQAGEQVANNKLSEETKERYDFVDWRALKQLRNFNAHAYELSNADLLIRTIERKVPNYIKELEDVRRGLLREIDIQFEK